MAKIAFVSVDAKKRLATFDVDGTKVTRHIPAQFEGTVEKYLTDLARGLDIEAEQAKVEPKEITKPVWDKDLDSKNLTQ